MSDTRILVIEDEDSIRKFLRISLQANGFEVIEAGRGEDGLSLCADRSPALVILDLGLPDMDGRQVLQRLRIGSGVPVLVLSVRSSESEKVALLDLGANDYVTKPFGISELLARVRALLRSRSSDDESLQLLTWNGLEMDLNTREVRCDGAPVHLAKKEFELLHLLMANLGRVLTHEHIISEIWGPKWVEQTHYLRVLVRQLRIKLGDDPNAPRFIQTAHGVGYRLGDTG
jgi:two-component system KDP operon response regulator KdpE